MSATWRERVIEHHALEVRAGVHDHCCEWREDGHYLCHCSLRGRLVSGFDELPGPLVIQYPLCPRCYSEVRHDGDSYTCPKCPVSWGAADESDEGYFTDDYGQLDMVAWDARRAMGGQR